MSHYSDLLLVDIGGTTTRLAYHDRGVRLLEHFPTERKRVSEALATYAFAYAHVSVSIAAPVIDGTAKMTFNDFSISLKDLRHRFRCALLMNDYEAAAYALPGLDRSAYAFVDGEPDASLSQLLVGVGTGFGAAFRSGKRVFPSEAGFTGLDAETPIVNDYLSWRLATKRPVHLHALLAGKSIVDIIEFKGHGRVPWTPAEADAFFADSRLRSFWETLFAESLRGLALAYLPHGGLFVSGGVIKRHGEKLDWTRISSTLRRHQYLSDSLSRIPLAVLREEHVLEGCLAAFSFHADNGDKPFKHP